jgi:hypothetical protein
MQLGTATPASGGLTQSLINRAVDIETKKIPMEAGRQPRSDDRPAGSRIDPAWVWFRLMRTDPALTYSGALAILGEHEHVVLKTVNWAAPGHGEPDQPVAF